MRVLGAWEVGARGTRREGWVSEGPGGIGRSRQG